jgi:outer membrane protein assembly factor BamB
MGRRRALAALAGMATGGLAVAAWELTRPGKPSGGTGTRAARPSQRPGTKIWSFTAGGPVQAIAVHGGTVYAGTASNRVYALNAATGQPAWQRSTTREFNDKMAAAGNAVYIADAIDSGAYALDAATGRQLWSVPTQGGPLGLVVTGGVVYLGTPAKSNTTGGVSALSAASGGLLWSAEFGPVSDVTGGLAVDNGTVYATSSNGEIFAYDAASGNKRWRISGKNITFGTPPVVADGVLYVGGTASGDTKATALYAIRAATGHQLWQQPTGVAQFPPGLAVAGGVVYAAFTRSSAPGGPGDLTARHAGTGRQLWGFSAADGLGTEVELAGGALYFGAGRQVYAVAAS